MVGTIEHTVIPMFQKVHSPKMMTRTLLLQVENHVMKREKKTPLVSYSTIFIEQVHSELVNVNILNDSIDAVVV
jgi:hypothetical protein